MNRPLHVWIAFVACLAVVLAAMGWVSLTALRLDAAQDEARVQSDREERVRLALWRMESAVAPILARENARPYFAYQPFYPAERAYTKMYAGLQPGDVRVPSPLLTFASPSILLHFQFDPEGTLTSPQVPTGNMRDIAEMEYRSAEEIDGAASELARLRGLVDRDALLHTLAPVQTLEVEAQTDPTVAQVDLGFQSEIEIPEGQQGLFGNDQQVAQQIFQTGRNRAEWNARRQVSDEANIPPPSNKLAGKGSREAGSPDVVERGMTPVWVQGELFLVRSVLVGGREYLQGCWLSWPSLARWLLDGVADLLPEAKLEPASDARRAGERMLAALPARLDPGHVPSDLPPRVSPIRFSLLVAWICVLVAAGAVGSLLLGTMRLSERRATFASAVTHELRTPLTTFRMYTEMLAEGIVEDGAKRRAYLETLRNEADRLGHLVENVLAYARLERGGKALHTERIAIGEFLARIADRLRHRSERAAMDLCVEVDLQDLSKGIVADASAVEQILFNLVDNACKYAASGDDRRIHLEVLPDGEAAGLRLRVRDHGRGIDPRDRGRLFRPFRKGSRDADRHAPGVGLGLSLSRILARAMGGDLRMDEATANGAAFVLTLPSAKSDGRTGRARVAALVAAACIGIASVAAPGPVAARDRVTQAEIDRAIDRGVEYLLGYWRGNLTREGIGPLALSVYALLHSGMSATDPLIAEALERIARKPDETTYVSTVRILALVSADPVAYLDPVAHAAATLLAIQQPYGGFSYNRLGRIDNSNSQFGILGFWGAERAGVAIPLQAWRRGLDHFLGEDPGRGTLATRSKGWGYLPGTTPTKSMTAAAVGSLLLCADHLEASSDGADRRRVAAARNRIRQGIEWLAEHGRLDDPESRWHYYYLYAIERLGAFSGLSRIGDVDWYEAGAAFLVDDQMKNGAWREDPRGDELRGGGGRRNGRGGAGRAGRLSDVPSPISTAFALLFLNRATRTEGGTTPRPVPGILTGMGAQPQPADLEAARRAILRFGARAIPDLLRALRDPSPDVRRVAVETLREMSGREFGYDPRHSPEANDEAIAAWDVWYLKEKDRVDGKPN